MKSPSHRRDLPAWIGGKDHETNNANCGDDQCPSNPFSTLHPPTAREEEQRDGEDRTNSEVEEPRSLANGVLRCSVDPRIKRLVKKVATQYRRGAKENQELCGAPAHEFGNWRGELL